MKATIRSERTAVRTARIDLASLSKGGICSLTAGKWSQRATSKAEVEINANAKDVQIEAFLRIAEADSIDLEIAKISLPCC